MTSVKVSDVPVRLVQDKITLENLTDEERLLIFKLRTTNEIERAALVQALDIFFERHLNEDRERMKTRLYSVR